MQIGQAAVIWLGVSLAALGSVGARPEKGVADVAPRRADILVRMKIREACLIEAEPAKTVRVTCSSMSRPFAATLVSDFDDVPEVSLDFRRRTNLPAFVIHAPQTTMRGSRLSVDY